MEPDKNKGKYSNFATTSASIAIDAAKIVTGDA